MKRIALTLILLLFYSLPVFAEKISPGDFAFGIPIDINEQGTIYTFSLTKEIYQNMDRKDWGDIRIFNSKNEIVPHAIKRKESEVVSKAPVVKLGFFPVVQSQTSEKNAFSLNINTDKTGAIINVKSNGDTKTADGLTYYLIDLSPLDKMPKELKFKINAPAGGFSIKTTLEYSNNLTDWFFIKTDTTLVSLSFSGHSLVKDKIELAIPKAKYLRLSWPVQSKVDSETRVHEIHALFPDKKHSYKRQWYAVEPSSMDEEKYSFLYNIHGAFPFTRIKLDMLEKNTLINAVISSRLDKDKPWKKRYQGLIYAMDINGTLLASDDISLNSTPDTQWQIEVLSKNEYLKKLWPKLNIGWIPQDLYFLNQGEGPFIAAFGNYEIEPGDNLVNRLLSDLDEPQYKTMVKKVQPGKLLTLGVKKVKSDPLPWQKWILWGVLVIGVVLLGIMAFRLFRQMEA